MVADTNFLLFASDVHLMVLIESTRLTNNLFGIGRYKEMREVQLFPYHERHMLRVRQI